ncbi:hypothetical protein MNBD_PLANCTO02-977 [hydrothermal vent metagenome]|uniref:Uncharacterized protein n=1 Tax=hydrothermal vent metagenome TaxID=652676 RepID=A0A3B1DX40_9ZZZZ
MPATINGIGTHYYGKGDIEHFEGVCDQCNKPTTLSNYETKLWFVVIFIPIIPLGRKMILSDCSSCGRHYTMPLHEWENIKQNEIEGSANEFSKDQNNPETALNMFGTLLSFNKKTEAEKMAGILASKFADNLDVQMTLGAWHEQNGRNEEGDRCFIKAFKLDPENPGPRRAVGICMIEQGRMEKAAKLFSPLLPPSEYYDPVLFYMLGKGYQAEDDHEQAMEQFELIAEESPELLSEKNFRKSVKQTEQALGRTESILPKKWFGLFG